MTIVNRAQCEEKIVKICGKTDKSEFQKLQYLKEKKLNTTNKRTSKIQFNP